MVEVSALKLRLLRQLLREKRTLDYFNKQQSAAVLEMIADGWLRLSRDHVVVITANGRNVLKAKP